MASLMLEAHFWTHSEDVIVHPDDVGAFKFQDKPEGSSVLSAHQRIKEAYSDSRGIASRLTNKLLSRDRDSLRQLEELLDQQRLSYQGWHHLNLLLLMFESGTLATLWVNFQTGNIERLLIDKTLVGKLASDLVVSGAVTERWLLLSHPENRLTLVWLQRPAQWARWGRLAALEPRCSACELPGPVTRRAERRLTLPPAGTRQHQAQQVAVWWSAAVGEIQPWTPSGRDQDRANVLIYSVTGAHPDNDGPQTSEGVRLELVSYCKTRHDPLLVQFSGFRPGALYTVEQSVSKTGEVLVEHGIYDATTPVCQLLSAITIPLPAEVVCTSMSPDERRLLLGCADNSLLLHNCAREVTLMSKTQMTPCRSAWHPHSSVVFVSSETGQLRAYDLALNQVRLMLTGHGQRPPQPPPAAAADTGAGQAAQLAAQAAIGLGQFFRFKPRVSRLLSCPEVTSQHGYVMQSLLITFVKGPLALLCLEVSRTNKGRVYPSDVICDYVSGGRVDAAINLLVSLNWEQQGDEAIAGLYMITNHLLKRALSPTTEAQLQAALASFLAPARAPSEAVMNMYGDRVRNVTRRFFHQLLRYRCYEKAFRLALDLRDHDLFMDLHYAAVRAGDQPLSAAALAEAELIDQEDSEYTDESDGSSSCSSDCSSSWHSGPDEDEQREKRTEVKDQRTEMKEARADDLVLDGDGERGLSSQLRATHITAAAVQTTPAASASPSAIGRPGEDAEPRLRPPLPAAPLPLWSQPASAVAVPALPEEEPSEPAPPPLPPRSAHSQAERPPVPPRPAGLTRPRPAALVIPTPPPPALPPAPGRPVTSQVTQVTPGATRPRPSVGPLGLTRPQVVPPQVIPKVPPPQVAPPVSPLQVIPKMPPPQVIPSAASLPHVFPPVPSPHLIPPASLPHVIPAVPPPQVMPPVIRPVMPQGMPQVVPAPRPQPLPRTRPPEPEYEPDMVVHFV